MNLRYHSVVKSTRPAWRSRRRRFAKAPWLLAAIGVFSSVGGCQRSVHVDTPVTGALSLVDAKKAHPTHLTHIGSAPQEYDAEVPPDATVVAYRSGAGTLKAWLGVPTSGGSHPAVLFSHGGYSLGVGDFDDIRPFIKAGYIVLEPMYRGENGNAGGFERYFGEVDDAVAALDYLRKVPGVDPKRMFVMGHSIGGTTAMLIAESSPYLRGAAACGAFPNLSEDAAMESDFPSDEYPFNFRDRFETDLRSPSLFVKDLKCPLSIYNSESDQLYVTQAAEMKAAGAKLGRNVTNEVLPSTDHYSALAPAIEKAIVAFNND